MDQEPSGSDPTGLIVNAHLAIGKPMHDTSAKRFQCVSLQIVSNREVSGSRLLTTIASTSLGGASASTSIFLPGFRESQRSLLDADHALPFANSWGRGRRFGPLLNTDDEDTLIALLRLMQLSPNGERGGQAIPMPSGDPRPMVRALYATISDVTREFQLQNGGLGYELRRESIKRLAATRIEIELKATNAVVNHSRTFPLLEVCRGVCDNDGVLYLQFSPHLSGLLCESYSRVDSNVRRGLADTGKAVHRFLSERPRSIFIETDTLQQLIGYTRSRSAFLRDLRETMNRLKSLRWLSAWEIEGTGRGRPFLLWLKRRPERPEASANLASATRPFKAGLKIARRSYSPSA